MNIIPEILLYILAAVVALFVGFCLLGLLARFFVWRDWMSLPKAERAALLEIERGKRTAVPTQKAEVKS